MATGIYSWSQTAASNGNADSTINYAEGQAPSTLNDSMRAQMAVMAKWRDDWSGVKPSNAIMTTAGSANAQTLASNGSIGSLVNGWTLTFKVGTALQNTTACTLAVDSLAAKQIQYVSGTNLNGGELLPGSIYTVTYHQPADAWLLHRGPGQFPSGTVMLFVSTAAPVGWTKGSTHDNKALRLVTGTAGTGGSASFTATFGARTIAQANLPSYNLSSAGLSASLADSSIDNGSDVAHGSAYGPLRGGTTSDPYTALVNTTISNLSIADASVTISGSIPSGGSGTAMDFAVQYVDVILATKD